jgi:hypothetical protein
MTVGHVSCFDLYCSDQECSGLAAVLYVSVVTWLLQNDKQRIVVIKHVLL